MTQPPPPPGQAPFISRPPTRPTQAPVPPPPSGWSPSDGANWMAATLIQALREAFPSKAEIVEAIKQGTKEAILEADD